MGLKGEFSASLSAESLVEIFRRRPLLDRRNFRETHSLTYQPDANYPSDAIHQAFEFHNSAKDASEAGDCETAIEREREAIRILPRLTEAHLQMASEYWKLGRYQMALDQLRRMREATDEEVPDFHFLRATSLMERWRKEKQAADLDEAIAEAQREAAIVGGDQEVTSLLSNLYMMKFDGTQQGGDPNEIARVGECMLVCLMRMVEFEENEALEREISEMSSYLTKQRRDALGISDFLCGLCRFPTHLSGNIPQQIQSGLLQGIYVFVCEKCVRRRSIPVDRTSPAQHRIWIEGDSLLQFGNIFVSL
jgi:tetratricopeptide (TPR) repeat protein